MKPSLFIFFLLSFICSFQDVSAESSLDERPWTYIFWINGDFDYQGPVYNGDDRIELKYQPRLIYEQVLEMAKEDRKNNYIIFFDPKGRGRFFNFNKRYVQMRVYEKSKRLYRSGLSYRDIDATRVDTFETMAQVAWDHLGQSWKKSQKMLYFYGEHFPIEGLVDYDYTSYSEGFGLERFVPGLEEFTKRGGKLDLLIMQTCYVNSLTFLARTSHLTKSYLLPENAILNTKMSLSELFEFQGQREALSLQVLRDNEGHERYPWLQYSKEVEHLALLMEKLKSEIDKTSFNRELIRDSLDEYEGFISQVSPESVLLESGEVLIPFYDYLSLLERYQVSGFDILDEIDEILIKNPHLQKLKEVLLEIY